MGGFESMNEIRMGKLCVDCVHIYCKYLYGLMIYDI